MVFISMLWNSVVQFYNNSNYYFRNKFVEPNVSEGFKEVIQVKFIPSFDDKKAESVYRLYLLEKWDFVNETL